MHYRMQPAAPTRELEDGDILNLGARRLEVLHTPGITSGSIMLYEEERGLLFGGESMIDIDPIYDGEPEDETDDADNKAFCASMSRVLALEINTVYPGHRDIFSGERMQQLLKRYLASGH